MTIEPFLLKSNTQSLSPLLSWPYLKVDIYPHLQEKIMSELNKIFNQKNEYREPAIEVDSTEFEKVVRSRRSVRKYTLDPIPEKVMDQCLELALLAPNSSNLQPWEFYWVHSPGKRAEINKAFLSQPAATTAAEIVVAVARTATWKENATQMIKVLEETKALGATTYYKKIVPLAYSLGYLGLGGYMKKLIMFFMGLKGPTPREVTDQSQLRIWAVKSTALACENLMLSFRAFGYDSCPMEGMDSKRVKRILNLPPDALVVMGISAGKRAEDGVYGPQIRFPSKQFIKKL